MKYAGLLGLQLYVGTCLVGQEASPFQTPSQTSSELVYSLTHQSDHSDNFLFDLGFSCPELGAAAAKHRATARSLVDRGTRAVPELEQAIISYENHGPEKEFVDNIAWLLYAYARILGQDAYNTLRRMLLNSSLRPIHKALDTSVALSLGLTSYVDGLRVHAVPICRAQEPRDALDDLIIAWLNGDRHSFESDLGPAADRALKAISTVEGWQSLRGRLRPQTKPETAAVGYRFDAIKRWSEPEETLEDKVRPAAASAYPSDVILNTSITDSAGRHCGTLEVSFVQAAGSTPVRYLVNSSNLEDLLRSITLCADTNR